MLASLRGTWVVLVCLLAVGCSTAGYSTAPPINQPDRSNEHHWSTSAPATSAPAWNEPATMAPAATDPYDNTNFDDPGVNPFEDPTRDPLSTFAMDVDTASYAVARRFIEDGHMPDRDSVRLEEFVNSFDYGYESPTNDAFAIHVDGAPSPFVGSRSILLRIGIQAREVPAESRAPIALTFVIDTSGSMASEGRLELVKHALALLVSRLRPDDSVAVVRFGNDASVVLNPTSVAEPRAILDAIGSLWTDGSTNAQAGLELGYDLAALAARPGVTSRVVLASDGVANTGLTDADSILARIDRGVDAGIDLVSIGVGMGNFNDALLEQLANRGNGFYSYINDRREAERVFGSELTGTLETVARDARLQVEFRPDAVVAYRLLGYENRAMPDQDFDNPYADAGEVGAGHTVTALYEIEPSWNREPTLGTVTLHWIEPGTEARRELAREIGQADFAGGFFDASPSFRLAATVAGFAEILRESPYVSGYTLSDVSREASSLAAQFTARQDVIDFARLAEMAARLEPPEFEW
jgi:Ca-activated chloride channel family protein